VHSEGAYHSFTFSFIVSVSRLDRVAVVSIVVRIPCCFVEEKVLNRLRLKLVIIMDMLIQVRKG